MLIFKALNVQWFINSFTYWRYLGWFQVWTIIKKSFSKHLCLGFCMDMSFQMIWVNISSLHIKAYSMFYFVRKRFCLPKSLPYFAVPMKWMRGIIAPHPHQYLVLVLCILIIVIGKMVCHCFNWQSAMTYDLEHFSICLFAICVFSVRCQYLLSSFWLHWFLIVEFEFLELFWMPVLYQICVFQVFFPDYILPFHFLNSFYIFSQKFIKKKNFGQSTSNNEV